MMLTFYGIEQRVSAELESDQDSPCCCLNNRVRLDFFEQVESKDRIFDQGKVYLPRVDIDGLPPLAVYNVEGKFYVSDDTCSHGDASLSEGMVSEDGRIECPWHTGSFCLRTGEALTSPADQPIRVYPVTLKDGAVFITPEDIPS